MTILKTVATGLLKKAGFQMMSATGVYFLAGLALAISVASFWAGYRTAGIFIDASQVAAIRQAEQERDAVQKRLSATDRQVVIITRELRDKHRELQDALSKHYDPHRCGLDDVGLQSVVNQVRSANARRGLTAEDGGDP